MTRHFPEDAAEANAFAAALVSQSLAKMLAGATSTPIRIVDVGAFDLDQPEIYEPLSLHHPCEVIGFEPQIAEATTSRVRQMVRTILPVAVGDGTPARFFQTRFPAASSLLSPNHEFLNAFHALPEMLTVENSSMVDTVRLDDVPKIDGCDLIKLDVQGGELKVLQNSQKVLEETVMIVTEVEFAPIYSGQPLFSDVDAFLRSCGFELLDFLSFGNGAYRAGQFGDIRGRLTWADAVYVKSDDRLRALGSEKILKNFLMAHYMLCNGSYAAHLLSLHDALTGGSLLDAYKPMLHYARFCAAQSLGKALPKLG